MVRTDFASKLSNSHDPENFFYTLPIKLPIIYQYRYILDLNWNKKPNQFDLGKIMKIDLSALSFQINFVWLAPTHRQRDK